MGAWCFGTSLSPQWEYASHVTALSLFSYEILNKPTVDLDTGNYDKSFHENQKPMGGTLLDLYRFWVQLVV